ncbi:hypothetical protein [Xanthobacter autotrophicus]|uniref:hypothetical protein n=1 Tax=Xanthobacter autotrophicus TaxID=280 RepID=UPI0024A7015E|nr:hypothetical protein [Xanthobacter autotrophicus]MDI4658541.1 hypothetical protein [Xanthobacter autotrophicus]
MQARSLKPDPTVENDRSHFDCLQNLTSQQQWAVKYLYDRLGIIDNKMSALLRLNGIVIGFLTVAVFRVAENSAIVPWPILFLSACFIVFLLLTIAEIMGALIFYLKFDRVTASRTFDDYCKTAMAITITREREYRAAFWTSVAGIALFILMFLAVTGADIYKLSTVGAEPPPATCTPAASCPAAPRPPA